MIVAITHADKHPGVNPALTEVGKDKVRALADKLPTNLTGVIIGTGIRFGDTFDCVLHSAWDKIGGHVDGVKYSPLLGSADSGTKTETGFDVFLADGTSVKIGNYIGLIGTPGIDLWAWLKSLPDGTLLCTGREFVGALGVKDAQMAQVYMIDTDTQTVALA